ncbi:peptide chain release factor 1-like, mitochondrial isoform X2 [Meriones unguiculatus]|uniref:peptide chain release factor 1-like, mitochondrial isoform X2 n=1 Tax=Meriones unguiculatus TaxID=10047 RepID=UPI00293EB591|nr:peptide chain release factor 1-like, mitochondrial isoform X2 [Meriones unguiculatus]
MTTWGRKGLFHLSVCSTMKRSQGRDSRLEPAGRNRNTGMEESGLLTLHGLLPLACRACFLRHSKTICQGVAAPSSSVSRLSHISHQSRKCLTGFPTGGLRHASASIGGPEAYKHMKFEGGVHRVQRVPKTEKQSRIHTSTMTVAILPQPAEIKLVIHPKDLRIDTKRASGAGGQHVNTTDSAVRIVHLPTGITSECQQERSQLKNRELAMKKLRAKLYSMHLEEETTKRYNARKIQVGTKGRSEKIRTYNFPQNRVTDHRINKSLHDLESFMQGDCLLDDLIQSLKDYADYESLLEMLSRKDKASL